MLLLALFIPAASAFGRLIGVLVSRNGWRFSPAGWRNIGRMVMIRDTRIGSVVDVPIAYSLIIIVLNSTWCDIFWLV